jgi:hypothetical protein
MIMKNNKLYYFTTAKSTDRIKNSTNDFDDVIGYYIDIEYASNRAEKLKRILFDY